MTTPSPRPAALVEAVARGLYALRYPSSPWEKARNQNGFRADANAALDAIDAQGLVLIPRAELEEAADQIESAAGDGACWFDHHGGCQEHGYLSLQPGERCPMGPIAKEIANRLRQRSRG